MIGNRIRQARKAAGMSLRKLAENAGISAMAISKYENDQATPSSNVLINLAKALNVREEYFFRHTQVELRQLEYRKHAKLPKKVLNRIEGDVIEQVERYLELEEILPINPISRFQLPAGLPGQIDDYDAIECVADSLRDAWDIGSDPILDLTGAFEERGIKILQSQALHNGKFDGLSVWVNDDPVIVVGEDWPGDRQRFTLAHELGHLILNDRLSDQLDKERAANRFAGAFLVPASEAIKELGQHRTWLEPRELCVLKKSYGLSMNAWIHRAHDLGIIIDAANMELIRYFRQQGWHKIEPCDEYPREQPAVFEQLVFHALAEDLISESKAAELMRMPLRAFRDIRKVDHGQAAVNL